MQFRDLTLSGKMAREQTDACKEVKQLCNILQGGEKLMQYFLFLLVEVKQLEREQVY